jgi:RluA family pseudouridine synthase
VTAAVKLSSPATSEFWEIPILYEDEELFALNKPSGLLDSPDRNDQARPSLVKLLRRDIERGAAWARERGLSYLANTHRLESDTSGVILFAKTRAALIALASQFGSEKPSRMFVALVRGSVEESSFACDAPLGSHPARPGFIRVDPKDGKRSHTDFSVRETFSDYLLVECRPLVVRANQVRVHLKHLRLPVVADEIYGGQPLWLSTLKTNYHLKPGQTEKPLISRAAIHAEQIAVVHPASGQPLKIEAPWPKDLIVAVKYLRRWPGRPTR